MSAIRIVTKASGVRSISSPLLKVALNQRLSPNQTSKRLAERQSRVKAALAVKLTPNLGHRRHRDPNPLVNLLEPHS